ncbi:MFS transporter [Streptomyces sp. NPDC088768]|uniref:MFS transporter n=1 Tax=Streptomyces sp. NPDC088768 TaxID=3365894 RepID=UPI00382FF623
MSRISSTRVTLLPPAGLKSRGFRAYLGGTSTTLAGTSLHQVALPIVAVLALHANPWQMGVLTAAEKLPSLLLALPAGVAAERWPKRHLMIHTDLAAAASVATIPLSATLGALALGLVTTLGDAASLSLVPRKKLLTAHARHHEPTVPEVLRDDVE